MARDLRLVADSFFEIPIVNLEELPCRLPRHRDLGGARSSRDRWGIFGGSLVLLFILLAIAAPLVAGLSGNDPYTYHLDKLDGSSAPAGFSGGISASHWFGVEPLTGRDLFSIVVFGAQTSLFVGISATIVAVVLGTVIGLSAGYFGGWWDTVSSRATDVLLGCPV